MIGLGTLHEHDGRWMLRFELSLAHASSRVWELVTTTEGLATWFPARVAYPELSAGSPMSFTFTESDLELAESEGVEDVPMTSGGKVLEVVPQRTFAFDWLGEVIGIHLEPDGDGCRLDFTHVFDRDEKQAPLNATGWHVCLEALEAALDGNPAPADERRLALTPVYASALASGPVRD